MIIVMDFLNCQKRKHTDWVTGNYMQNDVYACIDGMKMFALIMDKLMLHLTDVLSDNLFHLDENDKNSLLMYNDPPSGLLDFVQYVNATRKYYVTEHIDPGLFSLNIFSDNKGMQFYNYKTHKWHGAPPNIGILFCGSYAEKFKFKAARHRVMNFGEPRFSIWYEVGLKKQVPDKTQIVKTVLQSSKSKDNMTVDVAIEHVSRGISKDTFYTTHISVDVPADGTVLNLKEVIEQYQGIPTQKTMFVPPTINEIPNVNYDHVKINNIKKWKINLKGHLIPNHHSDPHV